MLTRLAVLADTPYVGPAVRHYKACFEVRVYDITPATWPPTL